MKVKLYPQHEKIQNLKKVKFGIDPTGPRLHLGHFVALRYLKQLESQGKEITIVLGTFTAQLGDPTGKNETRPMLSEYEVTMNAKKIEEQVRKYLPNAIFHRNGDLADTMTSADFMREMSHFTLARISARDSFKARESIGFHELAVPLMQAMDSVYLHTEIEVGGEDQLFNFELTRELQKKHGQRPETCVLLPIIRGANGEKMSKSLNNCIYLDESHSAIEQKLHYLKDEIVNEWLPLFSDIPREQLPDSPQKRKEVLIGEILRQI